MSREEGDEYDVDSKRLMAFNSVISSIDAEAAFPDQVFLGKWRQFLFFESDRIFSPDFINVIKKFIMLERAKLCCLLNFDEMSTLDFTGSAAVFLDGSVKESEYDAKLRSGGPARGWLFGVDRYGCASDQGEWAIYCEKNNDIAAVSLRHPADVEKFSLPLAMLGAEPIDVLIRQGSNAPLPFSNLTSEWRDVLVGHYTGRDNPEV